MILSGLAKYTYSKIHMDLPEQGLPSALRRPSLSMITISPGSTWPRSSAPITSSAQDSDATAQPPGNLPRHNGLNPPGSLIATSVPRVIITAEYAPSSSIMHCLTLFSRLSLPCFASRHPMSSASDVVWNAAPAAPKEARSSSAFTNEPFVAIATSPQG